MSMAVAQLGARMHYAVPRILHEAGLLERLYTDTCAPHGSMSWIARLPRRVQPQLLRRLSSRRPVGVPPQRIVAFNGFGVAYALRLRMARSTQEAMAAYAWAGTRFNELIVESGLPAVAVYGFNTASEGLFREATRRGCPRILEQTIAPLAIERLWVDGSAAPRSAEDALIMERERREWQLADLVICPSEFVREGVIACGGEATKCVVVPYGVDTTAFQLEATHSGREELRVLFVGSVGPRKGANHLLEAMRALTGLPIRCRFVGPVSSDLPIERSPSVVLAGAISPPEMSREYADADVLCLPSLCEGSATAIYEELAAGLAVVTTVNSGSLVRDGIEGFVVPVREPRAIADALEALHRDRTLLARMRQAARLRSAEGSLPAYSRRLLEALRMAGIG